MPSSTFTRSPKDPRTMTTEELRAKAIADGLEQYKEQYEADPNNDEARINYFNYCEQIGHNPDPEIQRLYKTDLNTLRNEWEAKGKSVEAAELEAYRDKNAKIWIASQPRYIPTPENADKIIATLDRMGMRGSIADLQMAFDICVEKGEIDAPAEPLAILSREEMAALPPEQLKAYIELINR